MAIAGGMLFAATGIASFVFLCFLSISLLLFILTVVHSRFSTALIFLLISTIAAGSYLIAAQEISAAEINRLKNKLPRKKIAVVGRVSSFPEFYANRSGSSGTWVFELSCEGIQHSNTWNTIRGQVDIRVYGEKSYQPAVYGHRVIINGVLKKRIFPGGNVLELEISDSKYVEKLSGAGFGSLASWGRAWRDKASVRLEQEMEGMPEQEAVLKALVLGYRKQMPAATLECFRRTGTLHIFAISGLHVGIVGLLLIIVLKTMGISRDLFGLCLLPMLSVYVISTGMKPSAFRALTMAGVYVLAPLLRSKPDIPSSVAFAGIVLLLLNPLEIQSPGFVYSFTVVAFIVMVYSAIPKKVMQGNWFKAYGKGLIITSLAANLASIPLSALLFGMFSPIALLGNLIVVPLTFCIVLSGWLSILIPATSAVFNHAAVIFINLLLWGVRWLDALPRSSWQVNPPTMISIVLWYGSLIYLFSHATVRKQKINALAVAGFSVLLALLA